MRFGTNNPDIEQHQTATVGFGFSGVRLARLTEVGYTLISIGVDTTGSIQAHKKEFHEALLMVIRACRLHPKAHTLLLRVFEFNSNVGIKEMHGFIPVLDTKDSDYPELDPRGMTPLYDAMYSGVSSVAKMAAGMTINRFDVNGVAYTITDGFDNSSAMTPSSTANELERAVESEEIESLQHFLLGCGIGGAAFDNLAKESGSQHYAVSGLDEKSLARISSFISRSISSTSQALGSGRPSQPLAF